MKYFTSVIVICIVLMTFAVPNLAAQGLKGSRSRSAEKSGDRTGFILGGGLGFSPVSSWSREGYYYFGQFVPSVDETGAGVALHLMIGYAWDDFNMIVYEGNVTGWSSFNVTSQGFNGAAWYRYYGTPGHSAFTTAGIGFYVFGDDFDFNDPGIGLLLGGGYEFARHWQFGGYLSFGRTFYGGLNYDHYHLSVLFTRVVY